MSESGDSRHSPRIMIPHVEGSGTAAIVPSKNPLIGRRGPGLDGSGKKTAWPPALD